MSDNKETIFVSSTLMGKEEHKRVSQLLQNMLDSPDSFQFRQPVDWKAYGLFHYPTIIKKPMDLGTVKKKLNTNQYDTVEACLADIQQIWQNCKIFNKDNPFYVKLSDKLDKMTKKMIKNYVPFVSFQIAGNDKKKVAPVAKKQTSTKTVNKIQQQPKDYQALNEPQQEEAVQPDTPFQKIRKQLLMLIPLCTPQQLGVVFLLINKHAAQSLQYNQEGQANVIADNLSDQMVKRLKDQLDMWGVGYVSGKKK